LKIIFKLTPLKIRQFGLSCSLLLSLLTITAAVMSLEWALISFYTALTAKSVLMLWTISLRGGYQLPKTTLKSFTSYVKICTYA